ncbi:unnamed protein product [Rhizophagus irregularis]|nr:unnamed protein product [Rhizophagus irregularis]
MKIIYFDGKTFLSSFFFNFLKQNNAPPPIAVEDQNNSKIWTFSAIMPTQVNEVIPKHLIINIPQVVQDYILPNVNRTMLKNLHVNPLSNNNIVKTFIQN